MAQTVLSEKLNSRMVEQDDNGITITLVYFGAKDDFVVGYNGWTFILPGAPGNISTPNTGWVGSPTTVGADSLTAIAGMTWPGYATPNIAYVSPTPRWTKAKGFVKVVLRATSIYV